MSRPETRQPVAFERGDLSTWGTVRIGNVRLTGRTAVEIVGAAIWILVAVIPNGGDGITALVTNALFALAVVAVASASRTFGLRAAVSFFLLGGLSLAISALVGHVLISLLSSPDSHVREVLIPANEEIWKIAPVAFVLWRRRRGQTWSLSATDVLLAGTACGAGFAFVEDAYLRHAFGGYGPTLSLLAMVAKTPDRVIAGHAIWTGLAAATLGLALALRSSRGRAVILAASGIVVGAFDHMATNFLGDGIRWPNAISLHGWLVMLLFPAAFAVAIAVDLREQRSIADVAELEPPARVSDPAGLAAWWSYVRQRRELANTVARYRRAASEAVSPPEPVARQLFDSLMERKAANAAA